MSFLGPFVAVSILFLASLVTIVRLTIQNQRLTRGLDKFDHDGDGKPGGSRRKAKP